jgi:cytochrome c553
MQKHLICLFSPFFHLIWFFQRHLMLMRWSLLGHDSAMATNDFLFLKTAGTAVGHALQGALAAAALTLGLATAAAHAAPFEDTIAQRTQACTACHGPQGRAAPDGYYPRLAGKPAGYLYNQLLNFREGRRHYNLMTQLVDPLSDAYLMEIAQYFSSLDAPYPAPQPATVEAAVMERGRQLVMQGNVAQKVPACVQCHGQAMTGVAPNIPGLLGLPRDYLSAQLGAWRSGQRRAHAPDCMAHVVERLADGDVHAVASWLAAQPLPANTHPATTLPPNGPQTIALACGSAPASQGKGAAK